MDEIYLEKSAIVSRQILLYFVDYFGFAMKMFDRHGLYRIPIEKYEEFRIEDKEKFSRNLYWLKQKGYIKEYFNEKQKYIQLTTKGKKKLKKLVVTHLDFKQEGGWDKKWRIVIFDIPARKNKERDFLRNRLEYYGFYRLQESVYVYPFECYEEIKLIKEMYHLSPYVQYLVTDRIETEVNLIKKFVDNGILRLKETE